MKSNISIVDLIEDKENLFLNGEISALKFWEHMDTYSYGKGLGYLPRGWKTESWKNKRKLIIEEQSTDDGICTCTKCGIKMSDYITIQHHKHPRKFKDILNIEKGLFANKLIEQSFERNGHKFLKKKNKCVECGYYVKFLPYTKKWECAKTKKVYDTCRKVKVPWKLQEYREKFYFEFLNKEEVYELSLPIATKKYIAESRAYRNLDNKVFPYSIYCRDCAYDEDKKSGKIKKPKINKPKKEKISINIEDYKPKIRIRRKK